MKVDKDKWALLLAPQLMGRAQKACAGLISKSLLKMVAIYSVTFTEAFKCKMCLVLFSLEVIK